MTIRMAADRQRHAVARAFDFIVGYFSAVAPPSLSWRVP
jgi:hypothetical protein